MSGRPGNIGGADLSGLLGPAGKKISQKKLFYRFITFALKHSFQDKPQDFRFHANSRTVDFLLRRVFGETGQAFLLEGSPRFRLILSNEMFWGTDVSRISGPLKPQTLNPMHLLLNLL